MTDVGRLCTPMTRDEADDELRWVPTTPLPLRREPGIHHPDVLATPHG
jgi:hypothetical protein